MEERETEGGKKRKGRKRKTVKKIYHGFKYEKEEEILQDKNSEVMK